MKFYKKLLLWLIIIIFVLLITYFLLKFMGVIPHHCYGSTMGPNGPVYWDMWVKTPGCPVG